jgi:hypothetical protein
VVDCQFCKHEALSSNPNSTKKKKKDKQIKKQKIKKKSMLSDTSDYDHSPVSQQGNTKDDQCYLVIPQNLFTPLQRAQ